MDKKNYRDSSLENNSLVNELKLGIDLVQKAGQIAQEIRAKGFHVQEKADNCGPVTEADCAISDLLIKEIQQKYAEDLIVSEEGELPKNLSSNSRMWFIDPIDGTKEFIEGREDWSIMIGLAIQGRPHIGIVYQPDTDCLYYAAKECGAFSRREGQTERLTVSSRSESADIILIQSRSHWSTEAEHIAKSLGIHNTLQQGSIGLKLGLIAAGQADLYCNFSGRCHLWDLCAPEIILEEAGGQVLFRSGQSCDYQTSKTQVENSFLATTSGLLDKVSCFL